MDSVPSRKIGNYECTIDKQEVLILKLYKKVTDLNKKMLAYKYTVLKKLNSCPFGTTLLKIFKIIFYK